MATKDQSEPRSAPVADAPTVERRLLTALSYDVVGSTSLLARLDTEDYYEIISRFQRVAQDVIVSWGGNIMTSLGDGGIAVFPLQIDAKDVASAAINAALAIIKTWGRSANEEGLPHLQVRIGVATTIARIDGAELHLPDGGVTSLSLALASRLQAVAEPDTVYVSQQTRDLARRSHSFSFKGSQTLKGLPEPENVWRALRRRNDVDRYLAFGRVNAKLVDRREELSEVSSIWRAAVAGHGRTVVLEGEAGIGKSRLLSEIRRRTRPERKRIMLFQCLAGGARSSLSPWLQTEALAGGSSGGLTRADVAAMFAQYGVRDEEALDVFSLLMGATDAASERLRGSAPEAIRTKMIEAVRRASKQLCAPGPTLIAVEDVHWVDPTSWQIISELARILKSLPILLLLVTRTPAPEALADLPGAKHLLLQRLSPQDMRLAVEAMWPKNNAPPRPDVSDIVERISGGVPLFIEEICEWSAKHPEAVASHLAQSAQSGGSILEQVLEARLKPLGLANDVIRAAAIAGIRFNAELLHEMLRDLDAKTIDEALDTLVEAGFVTRLRSAEAAMFAFRHALIQETIYNASFRRTREKLHRSLFAAVSRNRAVASWMDDGALADQAEKANLFAEAVEYFVAAGKEHSARSSMPEARQLLEHAGHLIAKVSDPDARDRLKLTMLSALGPVLTATEGSASPAARKVYEEGIEIARRRPVAELAGWFPIYWGWWFTGNDVENGRARAMLRELKDVQDPEVRLQVQHCVWAIDFYLGHHGNCLDAIDAGLPLYDTGRGRIGRTLYGGHDAEVCGLSHKGLSLWLTGKTSSALIVMAEARLKAAETGHLGSIVHACLNEAMLHCYRRDFASLPAVTAELRELAKTNDLRSLAATAEILDGWQIGLMADAAKGQEMIQQGLAVHAELQTPEDYPVYCEMLAELLGLTGDFERGLELLSAAAVEAEASGHRYWLAALLLRYAQLLVQKGSEDERIAATLTKSLDIAAAQNAAPLLLAAYDTAKARFPSLAARYRVHVDHAMSELESDQFVAGQVKPSEHRVDR